MGLLDRLISRFTNKAGEKLVDKAVNKIFAGDKKDGSKPAEETQPAAAAEQPTQAAPAEQAQEAKMPSAMEMAMMSKAAKEQSKLAGQSMAQASEFMDNMIFNDNMEIIGVKDTAPDWMKQAYKSGKLNNKK